MKAEEVLRRYIAGERNFRNADLRGQNFQGKDLSGADFSYAQIRGTNFTNANLINVNFLGVKAGLPKYSYFLQILLFTSLTLAFSFLAAFINAYSFGVGSDLEYLRKPILPAQPLAYALIVICLIGEYGLTIKSILYSGLALAILSVIGLVFIITGHGSAFANNHGSFVGAILSTILSTFSGGIIGAASSSPLAIASILGAIMGASLGVTSISISCECLMTNVVVGAIASTLPTIYVGWYGLQGSEKFAVIRIFGIAFGSLGGTRFYNANLTQANFTQAVLNNTNFNQATLTHICWHNAQKLEQARVGNSILANWAVRELLVTHTGYNKNFVDANLEGANLNGVNLEAANLTRANLSNTLLQNAHLKDANLREVLATGADFTGAYLTGVCLESWNIDHITTLTNVDCQYVFLLEHPNDLGSRERRPHDPDRVFAPGDFEKLYSKMMNLVQILLKNGVNREAFAEAFQKLMDENPDIAYQSIQAVERKGDDVLVTLEVPEKTDKGKVEQTFLQSYEVRVKQLEAENAQLKLRSTELKEIAVLALTQQPTQITNTNVVGDNTVTSEQTNQSQTVNISGSVTGSTINLGEISGSVSNVVNQLPSSPDPAQPGLKELLTQLQAAIETADELSPEDKADALEQVKVLAELGQNPQTPNKEGIWRKAWKILNAPIPGLPETATIVKSFAEILPAIAKILGVM